MPRHQHEFKPLFREPADTGGRLGYYLHRKGDYRGCACGMIQSLRRYTRGGRQWRSINVHFRDELWERAREWNQQAEEPAA
jgi:hypothetical protein